MLPGAVGLSGLQPISKAGAVRGGTSKKRVMGAAPQPLLLRLCTPFYLQVLQTDALKYFFKLELKCVQTLPGHCALCVLLVLLCLMTVRNQCLAFPTSR